MQQSPELIKTDSPAIPINRLWLVTVVLVVLALAAKWVVLAQTSTHWDENYYLNIGVNYIERGGLTPYMWRLPGDTNIIAGSGTGYGLLLLTNWFRAFGVTLIVGRSLMYIAAALSLIPMFFTTRAWFGTPAALGAVVFAAFSTIFFLNFHFRMDAIGTLAYSLVLLVHILAVRRDEPLLYVLNGVAVIVAAEFHLLALLYAGGFTFYFGLRYLGRLREERRLILKDPLVYFLAGAIPVGLVYVAIHVLPDPAAYFVIPNTCASCNPPRLQKELERYFYIFQRLPFDTLLVVVALFAAWARRQPEDRHFLLVFAGCWIAVTVLGPPAFFEYTGHLLPLMAVGVGALFARGFDADGIPTRARFVTGIAVVLILLTQHFTTLILDIAKTAEAGDDPRFDYLREYAPAEAVVYGPMWYYGELIEFGNYMSYKGGEENYGLALSGESRESLWEREQPQVFLGTLYDDPELYDWFNEVGVHEVRDDLWISVALLDDILSTATAPQINYTADTETVSAGDCTTLQWDVVDASDVEWNGEPAEPADSIEVCPVITTDYSLTYAWAGGVERVTIRVVVTQTDN